MRKNAPRSKITRLNQRKKNAPEAPQARISSGQIQKYAPDVNKARDSLKKYAPRPDPMDMSGRLEEIDWSLAFQKIYYFPSISQGEMPSGRVRAAILFTIGI